MQAVKEGDTWLSKSELINERCAFPEKRESRVSARQLSQKTLLFRRPLSRPCLQALSSCVVIWQYLVTVTVHRLDEAAVPEQLSLRS